MDAEGELEGDCTLETVYSSVDHYGKLTGSGILYGGSSGEIVVTKSEAGRLQWFSEKKFCCDHQICFEAV